MAGSEKTLGFKNTFDTQLLKNEYSIQQAAACISYLSMNKTSIKAWSSVTPASAADFKTSDRIGLSLNDCFKQLAPANALLNVLSDYKIKSEI